MRFWTFVICGTGKTLIKIKGMYNTTGMKIEAGFLSHTVFSGSTDVATDFILSGVVDTEQTFYCSNAPNEQATLRWYAERCKKTRCSKGINRLP